VYIEGDFGGFDAVVKPSSDYECEFQAWDVDNQEWITVYGWNCTVTPLEHM
jgi:hypothetical protein